MDWREAQGIRFARWTAVLAVVGGLHGAAAAYSLLWRGEPEDSEPEGVFVVELAPVTTSAVSAADAAMRGPESVDSVEARPATPRERVVEDPILDLPPLPTISGVPPDLIMPERVVEKPPQRKDPEEELPQREEAAAASQASVAARPQKVEAAAAADKSAAPTAGLSQADARTRAKWQRDLVAHLGRFKTYPAASRDRRETGEIMLRFDLDRSGQVSNATVSRSSGHARLDGAALDMLRRAAPLPPPPSSVPGARIELAVPIKFQLKD